MNKYSDIKFRENNFQCKPSCFTRKEVRRDIHDAASICFSQFYFRAPPPKKGFIIIFNFMFTYFYLFIFNKLLCILFPSWFVRLFSWMELNVTSGISSLKKAKRNSDALLFPIQLLTDVHNIRLGSATVKRTRMYRVLFPAAAKYAEVFTREAIYVGFTWPFKGLRQLCAVPFVTTSWLSDALQLLPVNALIRR